jgi:hypothetical protein
MVYILLIILVFKERAIYFVCSFLVYKLKRKEKNLTNTRKTTFNMPYHTLLYFNTLIIKNKSHLIALLDFIFCIFIGLK